MSLSDDCIAGRETTWMYVDPFQVEEFEQIEWSGVEVDISRKVKRASFSVALLLKELLLLELFCQRLGEVLNGNIQSRVEW